MQAEIDSARCFELKKSAVEFLTQLYHSEVKLGVFNQASVERVFNTSPFGCTWSLAKDTAIDSKQGISIENWIGLWLKHINTDPLTAFRDIYYIGYCGQMKDAFVPL